MKFINREKELHYFEEKWQEGISQLLIVYGKRRVGKTELIKQFLNNKPAVYFLADRRPESQQLKILGKKVGEYFHDPLLSKSGFSDWDILFEYCQVHIKKPLALVIDEFPFLAENNKAISSIFQKGWDEYLRHLPITLILCGSSISMMEKETLAYKAPLYGRRTGQLFIAPFSFFEARNFFPGKTFEEFLEFYTIVGGMPAYLAALNPQASLRENVEAILEKDSLLYREVEFLLKEELREPRYYLAILEAIAFSNTRFSEIINATGLQKNILHKYSHILEDLRLIKKEISVTEKHPEHSKKGVYRLEDQFVKFWFRYVFFFRSELELGNKKPAIESWQKTFPQLVAQNYEQVAQEIIRSHQNTIFPFERIGRWWNRLEEIDIVAYNKATNQILYGEVKWQNKKIDTEVYWDLKRKSLQVEAQKKHPPKEYFCLFSKSGFTDSMKTLAKNEKIYLFEQEKLVS